MQTFSRTLDVVYQLMNPAREVRTRELPQEERLLAAPVVTRLGDRCPLCQSDEVETKAIGGASWKHCNLCQSNFDPLEA